MNDSEKIRKINRIGGRIVYRVRVDDVGWNERRGRWFIKGRRGDGCHSWFLPISSNPISKHKDFDNFSCF